MKVIRIKKQGYVFLLMIFMFVFANIVLLYKFISGRSRYTLKAIQLKEQQNWEGLKTHANERQIKPHNLEGRSHKVQHRKKPKLDNIILGGERIRTQVKEKNENHARPTLENKRKYPSGLILGDENNLPTKQKDLSSKFKLRNPEESLKQNQLTGKSFVTAVLVIACNRPSVKRCLDQLLKYRPSAELFPIIVSQDCGDKETAHVIQTFGNKVFHISQPDLGSLDGIPANMRRFQGYYKISRHYKWALGQIFDHMGYDRAIVVEDDLDVAPDFFEYFQATTFILEQDPTLWCVSAWNDNGKEGMVKGNDILYRTDFFPGLGWMLTKSLWKELRPKWPLGFWDDWMREPSQRKNRACIRPEISRTQTFGRIGVSQGQFFDQHLKFIKLNDKPFPFTKTDLSYLLKQNYDHHFLDRVHSLPIVTVGHILHSKMAIKEVQVHYSTDSDFASIARSVGAMPDFKAGIPRMAYKGVVTVMFKQTRVYLTPE